MGVERGALLVVGEMGALEPLLAHPEVAQVHGRVVAGGTRADDHHAAVVTDEGRRRDRALSGVFEDDSRILAFTEQSQRAVPNARAPAGQVTNAASSRQSGMTPMGELAPVDKAARTELQGVLRRARDPMSPRGDRTLGLRDLDRLGPEPA